MRSKVKTYYDYRKMFDEMHKQVDAVFIAIPDHSHACATMMAIKLGKHVYCEKPLTHDIYEARALGQAARQYKVMTQMGNQGHAGESIRVLREYLEAGAIGTVLETHTWTSQYYGDQVRPPDVPVPQGVHWDEWIGPGPWCNYRPGLHPGGGIPAWYIWKDYGTGLLPCVGVHAFDAVHWGLQLKYPTSVEVLGQEDGSPGVWPTFSTLLYEFPRPGLPPLKAYWYGGKRREQIAKDHDDRLFGAKNLNHPRVADELTAKYGRDLTSCGTIFVGDKGYMYCDEYCGGARIVPEEKHRQYTPPPKKYARTQRHPRGLPAGRQGGRRSAQLQLPRCLRTLPRGPAGRQPGHAGRARQEGRVGWREHALHQLAGAESVRPSRIPQRLVALAVDSYFSLPKTRVQIWNLHDEGHQFSLGSQLPGSE